MLFSNQNLEEKPIIIGRVSKSIIFRFCLTFGRKRTSEKFEVLANSSCQLRKLISVDIRTDYQKYWQKEIESKV